MGVSSGEHTMLVILQLLFIGAALAAPSAHNGEKKYPKMTPEAAASCDPDYGWINGPDGTNKCYMVLRENEITNCGLGLEEVEEEESAVRTTGTVTLSATTRPAATTTPAVGAAT